MRPALALGLAAFLALAGCGGPAHPAAPSLSRIGHVFVLALENEGYNTTFGSPPPSPYLGATLPAMGRLLTRYYGIGHNSLDNYVAMVSGQAPNPFTQDDCVVYSDFVGAATDADGQAVGQGCVYPKSVQTIGGQLAARGHTWRQYAEDMAASPGAAPATCRHPALNSRDTWQGATSAQDQYATRHVPFVYFHAVIDDQAACDAHVVDLGLLPGDLADPAATPDYAFITPDMCSDGHDSACANPGQKGGYAGIDAFLRAWVPRILASAAYQKDGLLAITFDEADTSAPEACCGEPAGPNTAQPGITGPGGGRTGAILLSPCLDPGSVDATPHNHYSLLRTTEDIFGVPHLGYAGQAGLAPIDLGRCTPPD